MRILGLSGTTTFAALACSQIAFADPAINLCFHQNSTSRFAIEAANAPLTQGSVVDTSQETWNNITSTLSFSNVALQLADGSVSAATATGNAGFTTTNNTGWETETKDWVMMAGWFGFRASETLTIGNLPTAITNGGYHVVIYGDSNDSNRTMTYTIGTQSSTINDSANFSGSFSEGDNFAIISGLTGNSFTISGNANASGSRSAINGLRVVNGPPPQPPVIDSFELASTSSHYVSPGTAVTFLWTVTGADSLTLSDGAQSWPLAIPSGSQKFAVNQTATYTLTATNADGSAEQSLRVGAGPPRPNIVLFVVDDMGWQDTSVPFQYDGNGDVIVTALNQRYRTDNMQFIASLGMKFTNAYAMPVCTPTRNCLMTGKNSARHHVTNWTNPSGTNTSQNSTTTHASPTNWKSGGLDPAEISLPSLLQNAGYRTITAGKAHFGATSYARDPHNVGFDINIGGSEIGHPGSYSGDYDQGGSRPVPHLEVYHNTGTHLTEALTLEMNAAITESVNDGAPFFAYMTHYAVHSPFQNDPRFSANYPSLSGNALNYATMIEGMDKSLGDIWGNLETLDILEDTLIVFMSDNGGDAPLGSANNSNAPLRHKKGSKYEGGVRIPLIVAWAGPSPASQFQSVHPVDRSVVEDDIVTCFDIYPTLLEIAGIPFSHDIDGHELTPYFSRDPGPHRPQELLIHFPHDHRSDYFSIWRKDEWKLIYNYAPDTFELYDLSADISEASDLSANEPERVMTMARELARALNEAGAQWPTHSGSGLDDPFAMPNLPTIDVDMDGIPDNTEDANGNGLIDQGETDPDSNDTDKDGTPDGAEMKIGTDPLSAAEFFQANPFINSSNHLCLTWPSAPGALFRINQSDNLANWTMHTDDIPADAKETSTTYDLGPIPTSRTDSSLYFEVVVK